MIRVAIESTDNEVDREELLLKRKRLSKELQMHGISDAFGTHSALLSAQPEETSLSSLTH